MVEENKERTPYVNKGFEYIDYYGDKEILYPRFAMYQADDNLALIFYHYEPELEDMDEYGFATVNIHALPYLYTTIDTNNNSEKMVQFLEESGFGKCTGEYIRSGFCLFPVFKFNEDIIKELDPDFYVKYAKSHGIELSVEKVDRLDDKIKKADIRSGEQKSAAIEKDIEPERS